MNGSLFINKTYSRSEWKGLLEAILFVNGKPFSIEVLQKIMEASKQEVQGLIEDINRDYNDRKNGFAIIPVAGGFQLVTNPHYREELTELFGKRNENRLPKSCLETLAIIAYKQPMTKEDVDKIRGVSSSRSINHLLGLKLINISGSADDLVKSPLYSTTERFLEFFRIKSMEDLPSLNSIEMNNFLSDFELDADEEEEAESETDKEESIFQ
jgi:segregation and condensation protein B